MKRFIELNGSKNLCIVNTVKISNIYFTKKSILIYQNNSVMFPIKLPKTPNNLKKLKNYLDVGLEGVI